MKKSRNGWWIIDNDTKFVRPSWINSSRRKYKPLLKYITNFKRALDCGAHYGTWTKPMCEDFKIVEAFEGRDSVFECLEKNMTGTKNVKLHNVAIGDRFDHVSINLPSEPKAVGNSGMGTVSGTGTTPMITIDSLELKDVGFIKIDVEGYELFTLKGAKETIKRCKPVIIFEEIENQSTRHGVHIGECGTYLESLGATYISPVPPYDHLYGWN